MKTARSSIFFLLFTWVFVASFLSINVYGQSEDSNPSPIKFPTPKGVKNQLFYLQRDPNTNTIVYQLNLDNEGNLIKSEPVKAFWIRYTENAKKVDLNYIQRKFAYGIQSKELGENHFELRFVSHKKLPLYLMKSADGKKYHVYITVNNKKIQLSRIFVRIEGGSFWLPNVKYVELSGMNTANKTQVTERIKV